MAIMSMLYVYPLRKAKGADEAVAHGTNNTDMVRYASPLSCFIIESHPICSVE